MLRTYCAILALVPAIALGYLACGGEGLDGDREIVGQEGAAIVLPSPALIGTFRATKREVGKLSLLAIESNGSYHREILASCNEKTCVVTEDDGKYSLSVRDGEPVLSLRAGREGPIDQYRYALRSGLLWLSPLGRSDFMLLGKTDGSAWCRATRDCDLQNLPEGPCATDWYCQDSVCAYSCLPPAETE